MRNYLTIVAAAMMLITSGPPAQTTPHHIFDVSARRYTFEPPTLEVHLGDLVRITIHTEDIPHSLVVDDYRISKKVGPGERVTVEFLANRAGQFTYYCSLGVEDGCRQMKGRLVVSPETGTPARGEKVTTDAE